MLIETYFQIQFGEKLPIAVNGKRFLIPQSKRNTLKLKKQIYFDFFI